MTAIFAVAGAVVALMAIALFDTGNPLVIVWILLTGGTFVFIISLIIGHYMAEPLVNLHRRAQAVFEGDATVDIKPEGKLYEADLLAEDFAALSEQNKTKMSDLAVQQKRQTQFISDVAHELRTPLTAIRGNAETMMDPDMPPELRERFCHTIISESERLTRMANDLLTLQHVEEGTDQTSWRRVKLHDVVADVADALGPLIEERGGTLTVTGEAPDVLGNADRLQQVVYNLVANASRFIGEGGHVIIRLEGLADRSVISVLDDGPGFGTIDPKLLFTRFFRGDNSRARNTGGTGLGLAIAKSIVEAHDGTIEALNRAEGGACFIVTLPSIHEHIR
ncbi:cell wall metabolism sensor histidine kinase WalK [uncultured Slackia sp.]|uniref:sensor histidine kinase n=1 Tax=uncultured Slackia sp. TaxID=665903 RepID=UPI0025E99909|nr:HAMP domain-containing sensor histidine kinase [uncultured Slackia sp.]